MYQSSSPSKKWSFWFKLMYISVGFIGFGLFCLICGYWMAFLKYAHVTSPRVLVLPYELYFIVSGAIFAIVGGCVYSRATKTIDHFNENLSTNCMVVKNTNRNVNRGHHSPQQHLPNDHNHNHQLLNNHQNERQPIQYHYCTTPRTVQQQPQIHQIRSTISNNNKNENHHRTKHPQLHDHSNSQFRMANASTSLLWNSNNHHNKDFSNQHNSNNNFFTNKNIINTSDYNDGDVLQDE